MKLRLDQLLTNKKLCSTRSQARLLIQEGKVKINDRQILKPGSRFKLDARIKIEETQQYVGRGAKKIEAAIQAFGIDPAGLVIADVGASTGGFTDYLLQHGAVKSYAIDVGHGQLAEKLQKDPRVINLEKTNVRDLKALPEPIDLAVVDLAYISLRKVLHIVCTYFEGEGDIVALFKPQFECGPGVVNKQGVITNHEVRQKVLEDFLDWAKEEGFQIIGQVDSPITGQNGNVEYLLRMRVNYSK